MSSMQERCDYAMAVVRNARLYYGIERAEFVNLVKLAWDAQEQFEKEDEVSAEGKSGATK